MFAVSGWSVTAPLKTQTKPSGLSTPVVENGVEADSKSKKRKRKENPNKMEVSDKRARNDAGEDVSAKAISAALGIEEVMPVTEKKERREKKRKSDNSAEQKSEVPVAIESKKDKNRKTSTEAKTNDAESKVVSEEAKIDGGKSKSNGAQVKINGVKSQPNGAQVRMDSTAQDGVKSKEPDATEGKKRKRSRRGKTTDSASATNEAITAINPASTKVVKEPSSATSKPAKSKEKKPKSSSATLPKDPPTELTKKLPGTTAKLTPLQASMRAKLASARFRHLNETLYTSPSEKALDLISKNPEMFEEYHSGFRQQVDVWPENPVDAYIADIKRRGAVKSDNYKGAKQETSQTGGGGGAKMLPRTHGTCTIADLGCGDAKLAADLRTVQQKLNVKILSFDLHSPSPLVQSADIANLPLEGGSVNIALFCLALMGTNWPDFIDEAYRILHWKGELWISEIKSRFGRVSNKKAGQAKVVDHSVGKRKKPRSKMSEAERRREDDLKVAEADALAVEVDEVETKGPQETDVTAFVKALKARGFVLDGEEAEAVDLRNRMFVKMKFVKGIAPTRGKNVEKVSDGVTWKAKGKKFAGAGGEEEEVDEGTVLKPCVYKLR